MVPGIGPDKRFSFHGAWSFKKILNIDETEIQRVYMSHSRTDSKFSTIQKFALISLKSLPNITITQTHSTDN